MEESKAVAVVEATPVALGEPVAQPTAVIQAAQRAAESLKGVIARKPKPVIINGEQYLEFEDWQTVGRFYGYTAGLEVEPEFVDMGGVKGFKATAVALDAQGVIRSRATAYCMADEDRWQKAPIYQLASMAQTRANAKALRNVLSWIAVLAGYKPTPAEEMDGVRGEGPRQQPQRGHRGGGVKCPKCGHEAMPSQYAKPGKTHYCNKNRGGCGYQFEPPSTEAEPEDPSYDGPTEEEPTF